MAYVDHVAGETLDEVDFSAVELGVDDEAAGLGADVNAGEVFQATEGVVVLERLHDDMELPRFGGEERDVRKPQPNPTLTPTTKRRSFSRLMTPKR
jgi:hypothetical protein